MRIAQMFRLFVATGLLVCVASPCLARGEAESARKWVQEFYSWYAAKCEKGFSAEDAVKARPKSFSPSIVRALRDNERESKKHPGEIVGLDFDPLVNAQDFAQKYVAGSVTRRGDRFLAPVFGLWNGKKSAQPDVTPELRRVNGQWRFEDFHYHRDPEKPDATFTQIMDEYRREWRKDAKPQRSKR